MADRVCTDKVILSIIEGLMPILIDQVMMNDVKMVLYMHLANYQIYEEETALSVDVDMTEEFLRQYLINMRMEGCTEGSISNYRNNIQNMLAYVNKNITDITYYDLKKYLAYGKLVRKWGDRTYNGKLITMRGFFGWLYKEDMLADNPAKKLKETKVEQKIGPTLMPEQREEVRCSCETELELAICDLLYTSGIRVSEMCALNKKDIDFSNMRAIVYGKGKKEREIYFNGQAKVHLKRYLKSRTDDNEALFVIPRKPYNRMSTGTVRNILKRVKSRNGELEDVILTPHVYRRSVGTDMINKGAPLELVAEKLGHVRLDTTKKCYAKIARATVQQAHQKYVS